MNIRRVPPHEVFREDFDAILNEGKRQEEIDPHNQGEYAVLSNIHSYFLEVVFPAIENNDWVYEATLQFAQQYAFECFQHWKQMGEATYRTQANLLTLKTEIEDLVVKAAEKGAVRKNELHLLKDKASNFVRVVKIYALPREMQNQANELFNRIIEHEKNQIYLASNNVESMYVKIVPRIMHVLRRVIKSEVSAEERQGYARLQDLSEILGWYEKYISEKHSFYPVLGNLRHFYRIIRNVSDHPEDLQWNPESNEVFYPDRRTQMLVSARELMQRYRYFSNFCEFGIRGICAAFSTKEQGEVSNNLIREYSRIFPEGFGDSERVIVDFY